MTQEQLDEQTVADAVMRHKIRDALSVFEAYMAALVPAARHTPTLTKAREMLVDYVVKMIKEDA